jgi:YD repeat-containing protein
MKMKKFIFSLRESRKIRTETRQRGFRFWLNCEKRAQLHDELRLRCAGASDKHDRALNQTTAFQYDLNNRLKKVIHPDTTFMTYTYDLAGRRTQMTDERGNITNYGYDAAYRLISQTDALTHTMTYGYDLMSNLTAQTDALNQTTNYEYDDFNRLKKAIYPPSITGAVRLEESLTYDTLGNVKTRTDTGGRVTNYDYDTAYRLIKTTDANLKQTQFELRWSNKTIHQTLAIMRG